MPAQLYYLTTGKMKINLDGMRFGKHLKDPQKNVKFFGTKAETLELESVDPDLFTDHGVIELIDNEPWEGYLMVSIDCEKWGWYATAQIQVVMNGQVILSDNFQSGVKGPVGDPLKKKQYAIGNFK